MKTRRLTLRTILSAGTIAIVGVAVMGAAALVVLTTVLHRTTTAAAGAAEAVRLAQRLKVDLLLHQQTPDLPVRHALVDDMRTTLHDARRYVSSPAESRVLAETTEKLESFTNGAELDQHRVALTSSLDSLVKLNTAQARRAEMRAATLDDIADTAGIILAVLLVAGAFAAIIWVRRRAFTPLLSLAATIERFAGGERDVRATEEGPEELREMGCRFNEMASALAEQRKAQIAYLAGVAHDLRNPLSLLKMSAELVDPNASLPPEPRLRQIIERFRRQTNRLDRMVGDFLDMAKIEAGELEISIETHDVCSVVRDVLELFEGTDGAARIDVFLPNGPLRAACDRARIEQVLTNLLSNALKYSSPPSRIDVHAELRGAEVVMSVTDRGIGMSKEEQRLLFEPFRRGRISKDSVPGVGLGLSVVQRIVQAHRGRIEVDSTPRAGSTFRVYLPCAAQPAT